MGARGAVGEYGERLAVRLLTEQGLEVLDRNWRCAAGELDIVARDGAELVFVEVKTRRSTAYGHPAEAVTPAKLGRLRRLAALWLRAHEARAAGIRIDVVAVLLPRSGRARLEHLRAVG